MASAGHHELYNLYISDINLEYEVFKFNFIKHLVKFDILVSTFYIDVKAV